MRRNTLAALFLTSLFFAPGLALAQKPDDWTLRAARGWNLC